MVLPVIAATTLARILLKGGMIAARAYAKRNGVRITAAVTKSAKNINKLKTAKTKAISKVRPTNKKVSTSKKPVTKKTSTAMTKKKNVVPSPKLDRKVATATPPKKTSKVPGLIIAAGTIGGGVALTSKPKDKKDSGTKDMTFNQAFAKARKEKGPASTFSYKGKMYSTATMDDVKKAGFTSLKDYLNAKKK